MDVTITVVVCVCVWMLGWGGGVVEIGGWGAWAHCARREQEEGKSLHFSWRITHRHTPKEGRWSHIQDEFISFHVNLS